MGKKVTSPEEKKSGEVDTSKSENHSQSKEKSEDNFLPMPSSVNGNEQTGCWSGN